MSIEDGAFRFEVDEAALERALEKLKSIQYHRVQLAGETLTGLSRMTAEQRSSLTPTLPTLPRTGILAG